MSEPKFTPAPWFAVGHEHYIDVVIKWPDSDEIHQHCPTVASVFFSSTINGYDKDVASANANLIASAPDLYEALLFAMESIDPDNRDAFETCNAALAKARGEE